MYEERDWQKARDADTPDAYQAFLKQYPEGKWTEEARIRVENFTLAQTPGPGPGGAAGASAATAPTAGAPPSGPPPGAAAANASSPAVSATPPAAAGPPPHRPVPPSTAAASPPKAAALEHRPFDAVAPVCAAVQRSNRADYAVQLGAFKSGTDAANKRWERLQKEYPQVVGGAFLEGRSEKDGRRHALPAAGRRRERDSRAQDLQGSQSEVATLRDRPPGKDLSQTGGARAPRHWPAIGTLRRSKCVTSLTILVTRPSAQI